MPIRIDWCASASNSFVTFDEHDCELIVVNQIRLSPEKEMVDDMLAIVHTFSCRLDGMRKYEKNLKEDYPDVTKTTVELD